jgi:RNA polymerase sigma-70 factor, ECF subfamily
MGTGGADETATGSDYSAYGSKPSLDVTGGSSSFDPRTAGGVPVSGDVDSRRWVEQLRAGHPRQQYTVSCLYDLLLRVAVFELSRRRHRLQFVSGPEFDDLAHQAADDALVNVLERLDEFRGLSRFTTWAYKFVLFEVSAKVARHAWRRQAPEVDALEWDELPDPVALQPEERLELRARVGVLTQAIAELSVRQREVFVAVALNEVPIDVMAVRFGTSRNAVYKNLFDARRRLRARMAAAGHPVDAADAKISAAKGYTSVAGSSARCS